MSDVATVDLSPAMLLGPYGVALVCGVFQQWTNKRPVVVAIVLSLLVSVVTLGEGALDGTATLEGALPTALFWLKNGLLFVFGAFGVFSAALGMNVLPSSPTFGNGGDGARRRRWSTYWFD
jgi:hypothetical protein